MWSDGTDPGGTPGTFPVLVVVSSARENMRQDTDAPEGANDDGVSLTDSVDDVSAYATMYVDFTGPRYPVAYGDFDDAVDRPFWESRHADGEPIFGGDATDVLRDVAFDHIKPEDGSAYRIPYDSNDVPAVMVWSESDDAYIVVCDRDRVEVAVDDGFGATNTHEVDVVDMRTRRGSPKPVTVTVETADGTERRVDPADFRAVIERGPKWVRDDDGDGHEMKRGDE